jgi:tetratricopeptide (TPR) repeat protein
MEMNQSDQITTAEGLFELGMLDEAWEHLEEIEPRHRADSEVLAMRLRILERMEHFDMGLEIARGAVRLHPNEPNLWLLGSRNARGAESSAAALEFLLACGDRFNSHAAYWFELACLHCQAGDLIRTAECTRRAVDLDRSYQMQVLDHPDLEPLRASWSGTE